MYSKHRTNTKFKTNFFANEYSAYNYKTQLAKQTTAHDLDSLTIATCTDTSNSHDKSKTKDPDSIEVSAKEKTKLGQ